MSLLMKNELELTLGIFSSFLLNLKGIYQDKLKRILQILSYNLIENKKLNFFREVGAQQQLPISFVLLNQFRNLREVFIVF